jgi:hypothetical protein
VVVIGEARRSENAAFPGGGPTAILCHFGGDQVVILPESYRWF